MLITVLKSKIHRASITAVHLNYEGSIGIDEAILEASGILPFEQVQVLNVTNGSRFVTYTISAPRGSGAITLNGAAARLGVPGDVVIIVAYCIVNESEARSHSTRIVRVDSANRILKAMG